MSEVASPLQQMEKERGRFAEKPTQIPWAGWRDILLRVKKEMSGDNLGIVAAGVSFFAFLALFPAVAALVALYGLLADPATIKEHVSLLSNFLPEQAWKLVGEQLDKLASADRGSLGFAAALSVLLALWSSSKGVKSLMIALNIVYHEQDNRGFIMQNALALLLTLGAIFMVVLLIGIMLLIPLLVGLVGVTDWLATLINLLRWPLLALLFVVGLAVLYRLAPNRRSPKWRWVSVGALVSLFLWIAASLGFTWYVRNFGSYDETYGSIGAIIVLLLWLYISAYVVLLGAELNAEIEHQTRVDTTTGRPRAMGERGAHMADTVGEKPDKLF